MRSGGLNVVPGHAAALTLIHSLTLSSLDCVLELEVSDLENELSLRDCSIDRLMPPVPLTHFSLSDICA